MQSAENTPSSRHSRGSRFVLAVALLLILASAGQLLYRATLPTDGWDVYTLELDTPDWIYDGNLVGAPSPLQAGDALLSVDGISVSGGASLVTAVPPENWAAGRDVLVSVRRSGETLTFTIPVVHWTPAAVLRYNLGRFSKAFSLVGSLILVLVGFFTFSRRSELYSARALLMICTAIFAGSISSLLPDGISVQFDLPAFLLTGFFNYLIFGTLLAPSILAFALLFPQPKQVIRRHPWLGLAPYGLGAMIFVAIILGAPAAVGWVGTMLMFIASIASFIHSFFTQRDAASRAQLRWALGGFLLGLLLSLMVFPPTFGWVTDPVLGELMGSGTSLGLPLIGIALAVAVLRYRLYDIDIIIRKTLVYSLVTLFLALVYAGSVILLQTVVGRLADEQSPLVIVLSTLVVAALFAPVRHRVQAFVDRRFYRQKYDAARTLAQLSLTLRDEVDLDEILQDVTLVVDETLQPATLSLWLQSTPKRSQRTAARQQ